MGGTSPLVDRDAEVATLRELAGGEGRSMALVYGRRRIGKSFLLTHAWSEPGRVLYFTASATAPELNRRALLQEAEAWAGIELRAEDHPTWRTVFRALFELRPGTPTVIVLDEFQYLATGDDGLREVASELNAVWEGDIERSAGLLLVLSGSAVHALRELESGGSPLFGRLDWRRELPPFDYFDAGRMVDRYDDRDRILTYAAFGGVPTYLDAVDDRRPVEENIVRQLLAPDGRVRLLVETGLEQEDGLRSVATYRAILAVIGLKRREAGEIAASLGRSADTPLKRMIKELVRLEYLEEERDFDAPWNRAIRYRIADPAQRFYYGLVLPNESAIASAGADTVWRERIEPEAWLGYVGREVFEDIVRQAYLRHAEERGLPPVETWGRWDGTDRLGTSVELDVVTRLLDRRLMAGEVRFRRQPAGPGLLRGLREKLERLAASGEGWARAALAPDAPFLFASAGGFTDGFREEVERESGRQVIAWTLEELF